MNKIKLNCCRKIRVHKDQFVNIVAILFVLSLIGIMSNMGSYVHAEPEPEFGILGNEHIHASILVKTHGDKFDFSSPAFQIKSSWIHFEGQDGDTIHRHSTGVTLGYLFETLGITVNDECYILPNTEIFCTNNDSSLKFYINHNQVPDIRGHVIQDGDRILISYGNETPDEIEKQLAELDSQQISIIEKTQQKETIDESVIKIIPVGNENFRLLESDNRVYFLKYDEDLLELYDEEENLIFTSKEIKRADIRAISESLGIFVLYDPLGKIYLLDIRTGEILDYKDAKAFKIVINEDTRKIYSIFEGFITVYDVSEKKLLFEDAIHVTQWRITSFVVDKEKNTGYAVTNNKIFSVIDLEKNEVIERRSPVEGRELTMLNIDSSRSMSVSEKNGRIYSVGGSGLKIFDIDLNELANVNLPREFYLKEIAINQNTNFAYIGAQDSILVLDLDCKCPIMNEEEFSNQIITFLLQGSGYYTELQAQRIVRDFESNSLSAGSPSNEDGKIIFDYVEEFVVGHKEKFNPELVSLAPLIGGKDPYGTLDVILDDADLKAQFYQGFVAKWKEIFKNKLRNIDYLHEQAVIQIRDLKIEEPKKEYYITELNKKVETAKDYLLLAASTVLQPLEEKARVSEDQQSIRAELEDYSNEQLSGGCLIATATYGSELAPQVQLLREIRDNKVLKTESGFAFMVWFNQFYYSFSPTIADWERQNPVFKETVKLAITPLLTSLSILNYVDVDSEQEMLGYGIGIILMNIGMYFIGPTILIFKIRKIIPNIHY